ncbi:unnamed protein product, partial [Iphiclides podalirius]
MALLTSVTRGTPKMVASPSQDPPTNSPITVHSYTMRAIFTGTVCYSGLIARIPAWWWDAVGFAFYRNAADRENAG